MKRIFTLISLVSLTFFLNGCFGPQSNDDDFVNNEPIVNQLFEPIIVTRAEFESSVATLPPQNIVKSGKIYIHENLMFINDVNKGFHVYNYSNPQDPIKIAFIKIPGATDLAIRNNSIYINQAVDLVTFAYNSESNTISITNRNRNVFPQKNPPTGVPAYPEEDEIIIDWIPLN
ncbi:hypothetical protein ACI6PS_13260 [Flavobacterium sp. PLA-1-15]|uniref:hypothetical protein n=1 Tax=Flavobacterium sp. PLA-1-15 TaxID=3380533 RepID=UPI003B77D12D